MEELLIKSNGQWELKKNDEKNTHQIFQDVVKMHQKRTDLDKIDDYIKANKHKISSHHAVKILDDVMDHKKGYTSDKTIDDYPDDSEGNFDAKQMFQDSSSHKKAAGHILGHMLDGMDPEQYADVQVGSSIAGMPDSVVGEYTEHKPDKNQYATVLKRLNDYHTDNGFMKHWGPDKEEMFNTGEEHTDWVKDKLDTDHLKDDPQIQRLEASLSNTHTQNSPPKPLLN